MGNCACSSSLSWDDVWDFFADIAGDIGEDDIDPEAAKVAYPKGDDRASDDGMREEKKEEERLDLVELDEDGLEEWKKRNKEKLLERQREERVLLLEEEEEDGEEDEEEEGEEESEYETDSDSDEELSGFVMIKRTKRILARKSRRRDGFVEVGVKQIFANEARKKDEEIQKNLNVEASYVPVNGGDDANEMEAYQVWRARQIERIKKEREDGEAGLKEKKE